MTTREEIVALAKECGVTHRTWDYQDEQAVEAFYHAAQRQAYERAAEVCATAELYLLDAHYVVYKGNLAKAIRALIEGDEK